MSLIKIKPINIEQWRDKCTVTDVALRLALHEVGLLESVNNAVKTAPAPMQLMWDREILIRRNNVDLISFAKTQLSMADSEIDDLFKLAETK
jgi:hypothetical protein